MRLARTLTFVERSRWVPREGVVVRESPTAPYEQIASYLRGEIADGALPPRHRLPPARELATLFGVATATVQRALGDLKAEGLIIAAGARGTFVRDRDAEPASAAGIEELTAMLREIRDILRHLEERVVALEARDDLRS